MDQKLRLGLLAGIAMCVLPVVLGTYYPDIIRGDAPCGSTSHVTLNAIFTYIKVSDASFQECISSFETENGFSLIAKFTAYDIEEQLDDDDGYCSVGSIQLYNATGFPLLGPDIEYCSSKMPSSIFFLGKGGMFVREVRKQRFSSVNPVLVNLLLTEVNVKSRSSPSCPDGYFDCGNNYCINNEMICNGYDNCGNDRDEYNQCGTVYYIISAILASCVLFFFVVGMICCIEHNKQAARTNTRSLS